MNSTRKPLIAALGAAFALGGMAAPASVFAASDLGAGYMVAAAGDKKSGEAKCGEAKCGEKKAEGACGEGKCGEAKCGEKKAEGACGEAKCGEGKCGEKGK
ncbi:HvfA family oxazolone/thioamide-modified RiPP metallophore [Sinimarinibacterium thermocellulolyticum]|uniref:Low-complexity protein n=1 Tax=Sinimarinibacterium thermocellulolyticum TaxID=3170016 RepID=A0ABV2A8J6_9GAMM